MKSKTFFELWRWIYFVLFWLIAMGLIVLMGEFLAGPLLGWLFYDLPYALPGWDRAGRWALGILFIGFFAGTITWYYEKHSADR
jgi:hypothetical protein